MHNLKFPVYKHSFTAEFLVFFLPAALILVTAATYYYQTEKKADATIQKLHEQFKVDLEMQSLNASLDDIDNDIFYIADSIKKSGILENPTAKAKGKYAKVLVNYLATNQDYQRVRWIDNFGKERLRVDSIDGHPHVIAGGNLKAKRIAITLPRP